MALQVWLPLTKDLRNQGLSNVTVTNNGATFNSAGKLGGCYSFSGSSQKIVNTLPSTIISSVGSLSCWIKMNSLPGSSSFYNLLQLGNLGGYATCRLGLYMEYTNYINISIDGSGTGSNRYTHSMVANQWYHICVTYDGTIVKLYIDGSEVLSKTASKGSYTTAASNLYVGGTSSYYLNGYMNDARYYNHCLSSMEVKELAKGLVLHYPLNRQGWGQDNILLNTHFDARYSQTTGWDTTKNGTQLANSWGGYNSGVRNQATVYHAHLKEFNGEWVYEYIKTANESWLGISQGGLQSKLTAGKTYTFSWEEYHVEGTNRVGTGLYYYKTDATSANFHLGIQQATEVTREIGKWQKYTYTFTAPSDADWSKNMSWYVYGHYNGNGTFYVRHIKLEESSIATPWCPNSSDGLYSTLGLDGTTEYDCSGYCNNGTKTGTFTWTSDTPKYSVSTMVDSSVSTAGKISGRTLDRTNPLTSDWTVAIWGYTPITSGSNIFYLYRGLCVIAMYPTSFSYGYRTTSSSSTSSGTAIEAGKWHHLAMVYSISNTSLTIYVDGVKDYTYTNINTLYPYQNNEELFGTKTISHCGSDFRIYATALSASDVKSLYQNCATIDSDGTIRGKIRS